MKPDKTVDSINRVLANILPADLKYACARISEGDSDFEYADEANAVETASKQRKIEFLAGRECARQALVQLGCPRSSIPKSDYGLPVWPQGYCGVISHSLRYCCAIASTRESYRGLGLDLEMTNRLSESAMKRIVHPDEELLVSGSLQKASLLFSAKEAFYKMQFPEWKTPANFHDLVLMENKQLASTLEIRELGDCFPESLRQEAPHLIFRYRFFDDFVLTACLLPHI